MSKHLDATMTTDRPSVAGRVPAFLVPRVDLAPALRWPEFCTLPRPGERDMVAGRSRSWLIETNEALSPDERFLFRVRQRGKIRGAVFLNVAKLRDFLKRAEQADLEVLESSDLGAAGAVTEFVNP